MKKWFENNKNKTTVIGGLIVLLAIIGLTPSSDAPNTSESENTATTSEQALIESTTRTQSAPSNTQPRNLALQLYSDKKYGFTFEYPQGYSITPLGRIVGPDGITAIRFGAIFTTANGEIALDEVPPYLLNRLLPGSKIEIINGYNWQRDTWFAEYYQGYSLRTGGIAIGFSALKESDENIFKQVVRSVKFTKTLEPRLDEVFKNIRVGDSLGSLEVSKIGAGELSKLISPDNFKVEFSGQLVLRGFYDVEYLVGQTLVCLSRLDANSIASLPKFDQSHDYKDTKICFDYNDFFAKSSIKAEEGNAGVVISDLSALFGWVKVPSFSAKVVSVIE